MKKINHIMVIFIIALAAIAGGCASAPAASGADELDLAVRDTSNYLNSSIPAGSTIVILNIQSDSIDLSDYIIDELIANVVNDRIFTVVDRQRLDEIRAEQNFQYSGEVDDNLAQEIGRFLGAQTIVSGAIGRLGAGYRLRVRALNVQTAQVQGQFNRNLSASPLVADLLGSSGGTATAASNTSSTVRTTPPAPSQTTSTPQTTTTPTQTAPVPTQTVQAPAQTTPAPVQTTPAVRTYRVGDTGPAGGIIFYDKGNNSGGWRYLEAAPYGAEFQAPWSVRLRGVLNMVGNTQNSIGSGRQNTRLIAELLNRTGGEWESAVIKINELEINGFSDWFLPSLGELDLMYGNLKRRNLGDFMDGWYWSSTEYSQGPDLSWGVNIQNFYDGSISVVSVSSRATNHYVRPIRQVAGP